VKGSETTLYLIALTKIPGVGDVVAKKLIAYCGGVKEVFSKTRSTLKQIPSIGEVLANAVYGSKVLKEAEKELLFTEKHGIRVLSFFDKAYPQRLKQCVDSPIVMYVKGNAELNPKRIVSIVGTRNATRYGKDITEKMVEQLAAANVTIISGLAYGIDITAHRAALKFGAPTLACLAHGLDRIYPKVHTNVAKEIISEGALISDFPIGTNPDRENFVKRNRLVAGMADATIVIESAEKGGSLITAEMANGYNRDVFTVPGRVGDKFSAGCHQLIAHNRAALITSGNDVLQALGWNNDAAKKPSVQSKLLLTLTPEQEKVVNALQKKGLPIDQLTLQCNFSMGKVAAILLELEFDGIVNCLPGKVYKLV